MARRIAVLVVMVFFAAGTVAAMAGDGSGCQEKNALQCMYDWFAGCNKSCPKTPDNTCRACDKACCRTCQTDCSGKCCADCCKK